MRFAATYDEVLTFVRMTDVANCGEEMPMDPDDLPRRKDDALAALARQDLDPLSVAELEERIEALEAEAARTRAKLAGSRTFMSAADALFRKA